MEVGKHAGQDKQRDEMHFHNRSKAGIFPVAPTATFGACGPLAATLHPPRLRATFPVAYTVD